MNRGLHAGGISQGREIMRERQMDASSRGRAFLTCTRRHMIPLTAYDFEGRRS